MSGVAKKVGAIASVVAIVAQFIPGGQMVAAVATAVATVANVVAAVTAHPSHPPAQGSATRVTIGANQPIFEAIGRTYVGGAQCLDVGYGGTVSGVPNPYSTTGLIWSLGPVQSIEAFQADFTTIAFSGGAATGYYAGFMHLATQLGACPEAAALAGPHGAIPNWGTSYKLSGLCAGLWTCNFDKKGKVFASGFPQPGAILNGVYVYDARQDSTYPGGSGSCRALDQSTYVGGAAAENPACYATTYALGRFQNGVKVFGPAFPADSIDWPAWVAFANVCDANAWKIGGVVYEGPGISRWDNLKRICAAGAAEPCFVGGLLSVRYSAPKTSLDTITAADLADGEPQIAGMKTWRDRLNGIVPKFRSEAHQWEYVQSDQVTASTYVTEDGEEKSEERQYDLCQDKDQAAQLAAYDLVNGRELGPIVLPLKPRLLPYLIGEALTVNIPDGGLTNQLCTIIGRKFDPGKAIVTLTLETETTAKHAFALGQTGTAPPTPSLVTGQDMDAVLSANVTIGNLTVDCPRIVDLAADSAGTVSGLPKVVTPTVFRGDADIRTDDDVSYAIQNQTDTITSIAIDNTTASADKGRVTITTVGGSGSYELVVAIGPTVFPPIKVTVQVNRANPSTGGSGGGGGGSTSGGTFDATAKTVSSTTFAELGRASSVVVGSGQTATCTFSSDYEYVNVTSGGSRALVVRFERSAAGAESWSTVIGTSQTGFSSSYDRAALESTVASVDISRTDTPSAGTYDYRLTGALNNSGGHITLDDGPGSVTVA